MKKVLIAMASVLTVLILVTGSSYGAFPPPTWKKGDEKAIFGHSFDEEYWTNPGVTMKDGNGNNVTYSASYVNSHNVQAFLFALNMVSNANGSGNVPFQLFGLHYYTPENREVFIGSVFAFLMAFNDSYNGTGLGQNNLPDPGNENCYYIIPFGAGKSVNETYAPQANAIAVTKLGDGHYKFGIQYKNLYAFVVQNWLASLYWKTGLIAKFSELTVTYEIKINNVTGQVTAESWYTIGQITELWSIVLGIPIKLANPHILAPTMGLCAVHFVSVFTSKYKGAYGNSTGYQFNSDITKPVGEDINIKVGDDSERALKIGTRGTFDLINETSGVTLKTAQPSYNAIIRAEALDMSLVSWQLGFAGGVMSIFAYALSKDVQAKYTGPQDLYTRSLQPSNKDGFFATPLWYGISFPGWNGYRVVHDPVYTAYANLNPQVSPIKLNPGIALGILIVVGVAAIGIIYLATRDNKRKP